MTQTRTFRDEIADKLRATEPHFNLWKIAETLGKVGVKPTAYALRTMDSALWEAVVAEIRNDESWEERAVLDVMEGAVKAGAAVTARQAFDLVNDWRFGSFDNAWFARINAECDDIQGRKEAEFQEAVAAMEADGVERWDAVIAFFFWAELGKAHRGKPEPSHYYHPRITNAAAATLARVTNVLGHSGYFVKAVDANRGEDGGDSPRVVLGLMTPDSDCPALIIPLRALGKGYAETVDAMYSVGKGFPREDQLKVFSAFKTRMADDEKAEADIHAGEDMEG